MAKNKNMTWADIQEILGECDLKDQLRLAELKGVEVPQEVIAAQAAEAALREIKVVFGSKTNGERVFMTFGSGLPCGGVNKSGGERVGGKPYLTLSTLDAEIVRLTAARDYLREKGFHTSPSEATDSGRQPMTPEQAVAKGVNATANEHYTGPRG